MKKSTYLFSLFLLFAISNSNAQLLVFFKDEFKNNINNWKIHSDENSSLSIANDVLTFEQKQKNYFRIIMKEVYINPVNDYYIESLVKQNSGPDDVYGIIWGCSGWDNSYYFEISSQGWFTVIGYKAGIKFALKPKTNLDKINPKGQYNKLAVEQKDGKVIFYINDQEVFMTHSRNLLGNKIGFVAGSEVSMSSDYLFVKTPKVQINTISKQVSKYDKENIGADINSPFSEIAPVISPDGKTLYVARSNHPDNAAYGKFDIWYSELDNSGEWGKLKRASKPLNNTGDNVVIAITPDNNTLMLEGLYNADGSFKSDQGISVSYRTASGWSVPVKIDIEDYYNKDQYESFSPTGDRQVIIMSVERDDTFGKKDLYVSFLQSDGSYSKPKNMGKVLNSYMNEGTPFIAPDNKTLYFYSYVQPGYGSADIFVSKRLDDSWTKWSTPLNLGTKINSDQWDVYYTVDAKGDYAYLVSSKNSFGNEDVLRIKLTDEEKPEPVVLVSGKVLDIKTKLPISTNIVYVDSKTGKVVGQARSNPTTGDYKVVLPYGTKYKLRATEKKYFAIEEELDFTSVAEYKEINKDLFMTPMDEGETIVLQNIHFYPATSQLMSGSFDELDRLVDLMKESPTMEIELHGHTESTAGYEKKLYALSVERVEVVKKYLVDHGINSSRIIGKGFGGEKPIGDNSTEKGRLMNRRVEFKVIRK